MSKVYIPQYPTAGTNGWVPDLTSAAKFGNIHYIFEATETFIGRIKVCMRKAEQDLSDFDPLEDYILWPPSSPISLIIVVSCLHQIGIYDFRYLQWDRRRDETGKRVGGEYIAVNMNLS